MDAENDIRICISPSQGKITIEEQVGPVTTRKEIDQKGLIACFKNSLRTEHAGYASGFLPLNCLSVWQGENARRFVLWHPRLYGGLADLRGAAFLPFDPERLEAAIAKIRDLTVT